MIGQSMINIKSGGTSRLSGFVAGIFTLFILLVSSGLILDGCRGAVFMVF